MPVERLLVIDDSQETREFLEEFLGLQGYTVLTACDGEEGLHRALNENPDVILVDMQMPRKTGLEVVKAMNEEGRDTPIILMTARGSEFLAVQAFRLGARDYVPKPYEPQIVLEAVERALGQVRQRSERDHLTDQLAQANQILQRQLRELNALYTISKSFAALLDLDRLLLRVVEAAARMTRAEQCSLMLLDERELYLRATKGADDSQAQTLRLPMEDDLTKRVVKTGRPLLLSGEKLKQVTAAGSARTLLIVPLRTLRGEIIGVLSVANKTNKKNFGQHDLHLLSAIASHAATAIDNAQLIATPRVENPRSTATSSESNELVQDVAPVP